MINPIDLFFFLIAIISTSISLYIFRKTTVSRKPFHKIYSDLSNPKTERHNKINLIENLYDYFYDYSEEHILFDNLEIYKKESVFWYDLFFAVSFSLIFFLVLSSHLPIAAKIILIFITNTTIRLLTANIIDSLLCRKLQICHPKRKKIVQTAANLTKNNTLIIVNSLIIFSIMLTLFTLFWETLRHEESAIQLFNLMISDIRTYDIESINGNRFSLSTLFFTLAISGTVIFSITSSHLKRKGKINEELQKQIIIYEKWFEENEKVLSIKLKDIFNKNALMDFYNAVDALVVKLKVKDFRKLKAPIQRFHSIIALITFSYFTAIFTIIAPSVFINFLFLLFAICCGSFIFYAYKIFSDYSN
jgi:hypothetical protein